jgi:ribosomal-protein-alanine N-acetyltransferase
MEQMPYQPHATTGQPEMIRAELAGDQRATITTTDWQRQLPVLQGQGVTLRELELTDAPTLHALLTTEEVARFISPPPTTVEGFEQFIAWTRARREQGVYVCFAVVPAGMTTAVGIFQLRSLDEGFETAEWGFALGSPYWGQGLFSAGATAVLAFAFDVVGVARLEARSSVENGRGNGALRKVGARREATLRRSFQKDGRFHDQHLWTMLDLEWRARAAQERPEAVRVH